MAIEQGDGRPECCRDVDNLEVVEERDTPSGTMVTRQCVECGRNHYVARSDPMHFGLEGADL